MFCRGWTLPLPLITANQGIPFTPVCEPRQFRQGIRQQRATLRGRLSRDKSIGMRKILVVTGDAGESYEALYALHRFREAGYAPVVAAPSIRRLHLVMRPAGTRTSNVPATVSKSTSPSIPSEDHQYDAILILGGERRNISEAIPGFWKLSRV